MIAVCLTCRQALHGRNSYIYGSKRVCKKCAKERATAWYWNNREQALANGAAYRAARRAAESPDGDGTPDPPNRDKTTCAQGHRLDAANTYRYRGKRRCRACAAAGHRRQRDRQKEGQNG